MAKSRHEDLIGDDPPDWYRDAIIYQLHIRAFSDSTSDGVGDLGGLIGRLDYLQALGVSAIWVLPFYPSPLRDDGYDISDYTSINPQYGTMRDFRRFVREAHARGLRVITELVLNHTSDQHPWFQRARKAPPGSRWRKFYVWSDSAEQYGEARIIFQDFEASNWTWDPVAGQYFWHRFYSHQPDLNFDSADVRRAMVRVVDRWLELGVDGLRLDAVPYLYERDGTTCENLPETHDFLRELRAHVDERFPGRMLLAEANQWPEDAAEYFGDGDECHMAFHFPLMPRLFMATQMEDRYPIIDILQQTPEIPDGAQWALFLRNHDELTLEMVTDEERDYMYRAYAAEREARINLGIRRRLAPLLGNNRKKIELMNGLLLSLPGTPVVYYGDELGMGDNIFLGDRDSVRTPMQWSGDRNAGFSRANPQRLYLPTIIDPEFHYETINVETQLNNRASLLWFMRRLFALRQRLGVFGRGDLEFLSPENRRVLAFIRSLGDEAVLVVANLSRFAQYVELDLSRFKGSTPVELTGQTAFPAIGELPYLLTLGPHDFMWFALQPAPDGKDSLEDARDVPTIRSAPTLAGVTSRSARTGFEAALTAFLPQRRWFASKARRIRGVSVRDTIPLREVEHGDAAVTIVEVDYTDGEPETYSLPLMVVTGERAERIEADTPGAVLARLGRGEDSALVVEGASERDVAGALLDAVRRRRRIRGDSGELAGRPTRAMRDALPAGSAPDATVSRAEQTNSSAIFGQSAIMKVFRRLEPGTNPDLEVGLHLNARGRFANTPGVLGSLEYRPASGESGTLAIVHELVPNEGDAWGLTLDSVGRFYERILTEELHAGQIATHPHARTGARLELAQIDPDEPAEGLIGFYLDSAELLGTRVAEMHLALAADTADGAFAPEPVTSMYQRSMYQSMRNLAARNLRLLRRASGDLDAHARALAAQVLDREPRIMEGFRDMLGRKPEGIRIRCHGDLHLGQVLYTGRDFEIIDFEGEPARTITERRLKRSPLRDVAGMLRSFDYAAAAGLEELVARGDVSAEGEERAALEAWGRWWGSWVSSAFLRGYVGVASGHPLLPEDEGYLGALLSALVLEKATYELGYELNNRPGWVVLPLRGILRETDD